MVEIKRNKVKGLFNKIVIGFCFIVVFAAKVQAQFEDSSHIRISLITCGPGEDLYATFGHTAIRVVDTTTHTDKIYNYGTFDFYDPDFYIKFIKGKLLYYVDVEPYQSFIRGYQYEQRSVVEQELLLTTKEKLQLQRALDSNARDENKYYNYDFLFDNCATRVRDIILNNIDGNVNMRPILPPEGMTFRDLIYYYLNNNHAYWSKLGIDILLGSGMDRRATDFESMFLPDYLYNGFDSATVKNRTIIKSRRDILPSGAAASNSPGFTPLLCFVLLATLWLAIVLLTKQNHSRLLKGMDFSLFLLTGLLGLLLVLMWVGTNHQLCRNNFNLLWAIPFHSVAAFSILSKKPWAKRYWLLSAVFAGALLLCWPFLPQHLNTALLPIVALLGWRSWAQYKRN